jgi:hypothetical protein
MTTYLHKITEAYGPPVDSKGTRIIFGLIDIQPPQAPCSTPNQVREYAHSLLAAAEEAARRERITKEFVHE